MKKEYEKYLINEIGVMKDLDPDDIARKNITKEVIKAAKDIMSDVKSAKKLSGWTPWKKSLAESIKAHIKKMEYLRDLVDNKGFNK